MAESVTVVSADDPLDLTLTPEELAAHREHAIDFVEGIAAASISSARWGRPPRRRDGN